MSVPIHVEGNELRLSQTLFLDDAGDDASWQAFNTDGTGGPDGNSDFSGGLGQTFADSNNFILFDPQTLENDIAAEDVKMAIRWEEDTETTNLEISVLDADTGTAYGSVNTQVGAPSAVEWDQDGSTFVTEYDGQTIEAGEIQLRIDCLENASSTNQGSFVDLVCVYDSRFAYDFDNTVHEPDGYLDGPELFPDLTEVELDPSNTRRDVTEARVASTWDDVSNNQYIALSNDGETYIQTNNSDSATAEFAEPSTSVFVKFGLSRYPVNTDPQNATPRFGYNGQSIDSYDLFANPDSILPSGIGTYDVRSVIPANQVNATLREGGLLSADDTLLSRSIYSGLDLDNRQLISNERGRFDSR